MRVPYTYLWSQTLILKPSDWDDHIKITGFSFLPLASSYVPPPDLAEFLAKGPPPVYIGFGSIVVDDPNALTALIKEAVKLAGVRAIVSKGWGGVGGGDTPDDMYLIGNCPHDWLFQRVSAVVHHGGAGTTAAGIALGRPTVVVPFFGDQPFWGQMIARAGAGPVPVPFKKMTAETLAESIRFALKPEVQIAVQQMASKMAEEDGAGDTAEDFEERLGIDDFRCDLFPERLAVWHHKKTGAQLSGFAVSCLIQNHLIHRDHVKMLKRKHWYVDEGAEFPLVGVLAAVTGIFHMVAYATSVYRKRLRRANPIPPGDEEKSEVLQRKASIVEGPMQEWRPGQKITLKQMEVLALKMANKTSDSRTYGLGDKGHINDDLKSGAAVTQREKEHSRAYQITKATGMYAFDLTKAGLKTPVAFWYNLANGCHNLPSYGVWSNEVRRRDEITGLGSGFRTAGKEFVLGFYDAFSGIVTLPYQGAKEEGAKGFGKGCWRAFRGLTMNVGCAVFGLPGYTLKGVEKGLQRRQLTKLKAELLLIRLRQSIEEYQEIGDGEKEEAVRRWKVLYP
jgi:sterol 3beta-glucosyltransferase